MTEHNSDLRLTTASEFIVHQAKPSEDLPLNIPQPPVLQPVYEPAALRAHFMGMVLKLYLRAQGSHVVRFTSMRINDSSDAVELIVSETDVVGNIAKLVKITLVGVELNPGPFQGPGSGLASDKRPKSASDPIARAVIAERMRAKLRKSCPAGVGKGAMAAIVEQQVRDGAAKAAGDKDAAKALAAEAARKELEERMDAVKRKVSGSEALAELREIHFEVVDSSESFEPQVGDYHTFMPRLLPVQVCVAKLAEVSVTTEKPVLGCEPAKCNTEFNVNLRYSLSLLSFGIAGMCPNPSLAIEDAWINLDMLRLFEAKQLGVSGSYNVVHARLVAFTPSHLNLHYDNIVPGWFTPMANRLFTALIVRHNPKPCGMNVIYQAIFGEYRKQLNNKFSDLAKFLPVESGTYIQGYKADISDIFPEWVDDLRVNAKAKLDEVLAAGTYALFRNPNPNVQEKKSSLYCRLCTACHIADFVPCFPDPFTVENLTAGAIKRLIGLQPKTSEQGMAYHQVIASAIADFVEDTDGEYDVKSVIAEGRERADAQPWSDNERLEYICGVARGAETTTNPLTPAELKDLADLGWFIKSETYTQSKIKPVRFIICPKHYYRGLLWAILHMSEERIVAKMQAHLVKGLNRQQMLDKVSESFSGTPYRVVEGDATSFERHVTRERQMLCEVPIYAAAAPPCMKQSVAQLLRAMATNTPRFLGSAGDIIGTVMRYSGTQQTSVGNMLENTCIWFSMLAEALDIAPENAASFYQYYSLPYLVEGDDILIAIPDELDAAKFKQVSVEQGNILTADVYPRFEDASFCGTTVERLPDGRFVRVKEPLEALSRVFSRFGTHGQDAARDVELLVAKARSYLLEFPGVPILSPICKMVLDRYDHLGQRLRSELARHFDCMPVKLSGLGQFMIRQFSYDKMKLRNLVYEDIPDAASQVSDAMRARVAQLYGLSVPFQLAVEREFAEGVGNVAAVSCPTLVSYWKTLPGPAGMVTRIIEGARQKAERQMTLSSEAIKVAESSMWLPDVAKVPMNVISGLLMTVVGLMTLFTPMIMLILLILMFIGIVALLVVVKLCGYQIKYAMRAVVLAFACIIVVMCWPVLLVGARILIYVLRRNMPTRNSIARFVNWTTTFYPCFGPGTKPEGVEGHANGHVVDLASVGTTDWPAGSDG